MQPASNVIVTFREQGFHTTDRLYHTFRIRSNHSLATTYKRLAKLLNLTILTQHRSSGNGGYEATAFGTMAEDTGVTYSVHLSHCRE